MTSRPTSSSPLSSSHLPTSFLYPYHGLYSILLRSVIHCTVALLSHRALSCIMLSSPHILPIRTILLRPLLFARPQSFMYVCKLSVPIVTLALRIDISCQASHALEIVHSKKLYYRPRPTQHTLKILRYKHRTAPGSV